MEENIERKGREQNGREKQFKEKNIVSKLVRLGQDECTLDGIER